jgi:Holliday junction resolvase
MVTIGDALDVTGWAWIHHRPARRKDGKWTTPTQGNSSKGFPDIVAVRSPRVLWIEVKTNAGRATPEQKQWIESLCSSGQEAHVLHFPRDWHRFDVLIAVEPQQLTITSSSSVTDDLSLCGAALQVES